MQDKKGELKKIESLLEEIKIIQKKTIENNSENPFNEQLIKKNLIINKLTKELISKQKINEKILLVFGFLKRKILETQKTKEKFDSLKEKKTEIEGKLFKSEKDKRILVIETENLEREVITLKTLLNKETKTNSKLTNELGKIFEQKREEKSEENKEKLELTKKLFELNKLKRILIEIKKEKDKLKENNLILKHEKEFSKQKQIKLKKELFLTSKILKYHSEDNETLKEITKKVSSKGDIGGKQLVYIISKLKEKLAEEENKNENHEIDIQKKKGQLILETNSSGAFKKRLLETGRVNKQLIKESYEKDQNIILLNKQIKRIISDKEKKLKEQKEFIEKQTKEYRETIKELTKKRLEEEIKLKSFSKKRLRPTNKIFNKQSLDQKNSANSPSRKILKKPIKYFEENKTKKDNIEGIIPLITIALEHGDTKEKIKQSLINFGHEEETINKAIKTLE